MFNAKLFLDHLHVRKYLSPRLGFVKSSGLAFLVLIFFCIALYAPSDGDVQNTKADYIRSQAAYLIKFRDYELNRACFNPQDTTILSQRAESRTFSSVWNKIRFLGP